MKRSDRYAALADQLMFGCVDSIDPKNGKSVLPPEEGTIWLGTLLYVAGQYQETRSELPTNIAGINLLETCQYGIEEWHHNGNAIDRCFMAMGLGLLGPCDDKHPIYSRLSKAAQCFVQESCKVTHRFSNNWEAFNASIQAGRYRCFADDPLATASHVDAILSMFDRSGYFDDKPPFGNYNSYACMSLDFIIRVAKLLPQDAEYTQSIYRRIKPHVQRHIRLFQHFIDANGFGWQPGRSVGVLGQLQCLVIIEQSLSLGWLNVVDAAWARRAARLLTDFLCDHFWDEEQSWFSFHDDEHSCYNYRKNVPMAWDCLRYLLQLEFYASQDEKQYEQVEAENIQREVVHRLVELDAQRHCTWYVWSNGTTRIQVPYIGGPGWPSCDTLPRPMCPGLAEGITGRQYPILVPAIKFQGQYYYPCYWPSEMVKIGIEGEFDTVTAHYAALISDHGNRKISNTSWQSTWLFKSGEIRRRDKVQLDEALKHDGLLMEVLQPRQFKDRETYPIRQLSVSLESDVEHINCSSLQDIPLGEEYRNYFGRPIQHWIISAPAGTWQGVYEWETIIRYK